MGQKASHSKKIEPRAIALLPLACFVILFLGAGLYFQSQGVASAFYELSSVIAILPCIALAIFIAKDTPKTALNQFIEGIGQNTIITMCLIFLLAGGFSEVAKSTGGVQATTYLGLTLIPHDFLLPGLFIITGIIATAMGTSMGTLAAVGPIGIGIAEAANIPAYAMAGTLLSGAMFGDNLSIISDTTISATRTQGCQMQDKFKENIIIALPAALICLLIFMSVQHRDIDLEQQSFEMMAVIPYLSILILALFGLNVFAVLSIGILLAGGIEYLTGDYSLITFGKDLYIGFTNMQDIFLLSMLIGGLAHMTQAQGGLSYIHHQIQRLISRFSKLSDSAEKKSAEMGIGCLAALSNLCIANNTISILITGQIAKDIAKKYNITPPRSASLLDIFACFVQGLLPYGAQVLLISEIFNITPPETVANTWYCMILAIISILFIFFKNRPLL